jgi:hypothetical protein
MRTSSYMTFRRLKMRCAPRPRTLSSFGFPARARAGILLVQSGDRYELACATARTQSRYALLEEAGDPAPQGHEEPVPVAWVDGVPWLANCGGYGSGVLGARPGSQDCRQVAN